MPWQDLLLNQPRISGYKIAKTQKLTQILNFYCTWQVHIFAMSALKGEVYNATFVIGVEEIAWLFNLIAANSQVLSHSVEKSILKVSLKKIQKNFRTKNQPLNSKKYLIVESRARFLSAKFKNETFLVIFKHCDILCKKRDVVFFLKVLKVWIIRCIFFCWKSIWKRQWLSIWGATTGISSKRHLAGFVTTILK